MSLTPEHKRQIHTYISKKISTDIGSISSYISVPHDPLYPELKSLVRKDILQTKTVVKDQFCTTDLGNEVIKHKTLEYLLYRKLLELFKGIFSLDEGLSALSKEFSTINEKIVKKTFFLSIKRGFILKEKAENTFSVKEGKEDDVSELLASQKGKLNNLDAKQIKIWTEKKYIKKLKVKTEIISAGPQFEKLLQSEEETAEVLPAYFSNPTSLKPLNLEAKGKEMPFAGCLHPLMRLRTAFRNIFLEMGFEEMETGSYVERAFWNFDSLFIPQQHPARDLQDTFYIDENPFEKKFYDGVISENKRTGLRLEFEDEECAKVHKEHYEGWKSDFDKKETEKYLLRTHTTAVTSKMLRELGEKAKKGEIVEAKLFSIDRVFRNETLDATHLAEFHQLEGCIAGPDIGLAHLIGILEYFFKRIGIEQLKFKIAFNPYTEPSVEVFGYSKELKKFIEIGNSGVFRREVLDPAGIPQNVNVIAWGLSLERPAMLMHGVNDIRKLCGNNISLNLAKESRWLMF